MGTFHVWADVTFCSHNSQGVPVAQCCEVLTALRQQRSASAYRAGLRKRRFFSQKTHPSTWLRMLVGAATEFAARVAQHLDRRVVSVLLFGSRERGDAKLDSDMGVAVVLTDIGLEACRTVRFLAVEVWLAYGIYLSTRVWSLAHWKKMAALQTLLYRNVCRDGIEIHSPQAAWVEPA